MKSLFLAIPFLSTAVFGALPPLAQSSRELQAIVSDSHLQQLLGSAEWIREVVKTESGYAVITPGYYLKVDVEYLSSRHPGPIPFKLHFFEPIRLKTATEGENNHE